MAVEKPFRFLDLPKELRLNIYDHLVTITRHYQIETNEYYGARRRLRPTGITNYLDIVTTRIPGTSILLTCSAIYEEAKDLRKKIEKLAAEPLRLMVKFSDLGYAMMETILVCAAMEDRCHGSEGIELIEGYIAHVDKGYEGCNEDFTFIKKGFCDFDTHDQLHNILRRASSSGAVRRIDIAVRCDNGSEVSDLRSRSWESWDFVRPERVHKLTGGSGSLLIYLRPTPLTKTSEQWFTGDEIRQRSRYPQHLDGRYEGRWICHLGTEIDGTEWERIWAVDGVF